MRGKGGQGRKGEEGRKRRRNGRIGGGKERKGRLLSLGLYYMSPTLLPEEESFHALVESESSNKSSNDSSIPPGSSSVHNYSLPPEYSDHG